MNLEKVLEAFNLNNIKKDISILKGGNINQSFLIFDNDNNGYVVQIINTNVFKDPVSVMNNIDLITSHIKNKGKSTLEFLKTKESKNYYYFDGDYYRISKYIKNSKTVANVSDLDIIKDVGSAYGSFQKDLVDLNLSSLVETIEDFHNTPLRLDSLKKAIETGNKSRYAEIKEEIEHLLSYEKEVSKIKDALDKKLIPIRITHNDTKADNVLFDVLNGKVLCVIDLDTVMPGSLLYDFGDSIRSIASNTKEDEVDLSLVGFNLDKFKSFSTGFLKETNDLLTKSEIELLPNSVLTMAIELAARFYKDYLDDDKYFNISYPLQNLVRARCILKLSDEIYNNYKEMEKIINSLIKE